MTIRIIFDGKTYQEFETTEIDDSRFSDDKYEEIHAILDGLLPLLKDRTEVKQTASPAL